MANIITFNHNELSREQFAGLDCFDGCQIVVAQRVYDEIKWNALMQARDRYGFKLVYEIDDDLEGIPVENPAFYAFKHQKYLLRNFRSGLRMSDVVVASTVALRRKLLQYNCNIFIVGNAIDFWLLNRINKPRPDDKVRLFWYGSNSHLEDILIAMKPIQRILSKYPNVKIVFWGFKPMQHDIDRTKAYGGDISRTFNFNEFYKLYSKRIEFYKFVPFEQFHSQLGDFGIDISLAPIVDNPFNRCRTNLKWLESSAIGVPTICQNNMTYNLSVKHGHTGLLCSDEEEWVQSIDRLIADEGMRRELASNARAEVLDNWNEDGFAQRLLEFWSRVWENDTKNLKQSV